MNKIPYFASERSELVGQLIDIFEDFLQVKRISIYNEDRENDTDAAILYGQDYGDIQTVVEDTLIRWGIIGSPDEKPEEYKICMKWILRNGYISTTYTSFPTKEEAEEELEERKVTIQSVLGVSDKYNIFTDNSALNGRDIIACEFSIFGEKENA